MTTIFDSLLSSGLPITWTTVYLARKGLPDVPTPLPNLMTTAQLQNYAVDQIADAPPELDAPIARLAFADETDTWTIQCCLEELTSAIPEEIQLAQRIWRWVLLNEIVTKLEGQAANETEESDPNFLILHAP